MKKNLSVILGLLLAFIAGGLLLLAQGFNPVASYVSMFKNSVLTEIAVGNTLARMAVLLILGLSAFIGFNSGVSNLGQFGQLLTGALAATLIGLNVNLPSVLLIPLMLVAAAVAGALVSGFAGYLRRWFNMNEFITTLMLNIIIEYFITYLVTNPMRDPASQWPMSAAVARAGVLPKVSILDLSVLIAVVIYIVIFIYWNYSRQGYEYRMTGVNDIFARLGGCTVPKNHLRAMLISGALSGIAGGFLIMGSTQQNKLIPSLGKTNANDGLMIAIISGSSLPSVLIFSLFFGMIQTGAVGMQMDTNVPSEFTIMLQATMVLFVVGFRDYSQVFLNAMRARLQARKMKASSNELSN